MKKGEKTDLPQEWRDYGARWGEDGLLYLGEWRQGFTIHKLRALFFECQQARGLAHENKRLRKEIEEARKRLIEMQKRLNFYRAECHRAAKIGIVLLPYPPQHEGD